jgi:hypothetical protein
MFKKKAKEPGIFDDLPVFQGHPSTQREEQKKSGRRAMLIPDKPATADLSSDQLVVNTGRQKEEWLEVIYQSAHREAKQKAIATWLQDSYRVQKWWANSIALMYLKWREAPKNSASTDSVLRVSQSIKAPNFRVFSILKYWLNMSSLLINLQLRIEQYSGIHYSIRLQVRYLDEQNH